MCQACWNCVAPNHALIESYQVVCEKKCQENWMLRIMFWNVEISTNIKNSISWHSTIIELFMGNDFSIWKTYTDIHSTCQLLLIIEQKVVWKTSKELKIGYDNPSHMKTRPITVQIFIQSMMLESKTFDMKSASNSKTKGTTRLPKHV